MANVFDVAKYILYKKERISMWKLQKLCFYSQAWAIVWTEKPLFEEEFEAWSNGPVCPALFEKHKGKFFVEFSDIDGNIDNLTPNEKETIDIVLNDYGNMTPYDLREQTHQEMPWKNARQGIPEGTSSNVTITKESMGAYYGSL